MNSVFLVSACCALFVIVHGDSIHHENSWSYYDRVFSSLSDKDRFYLSRRSPASHDDHFLTSLFNGKDSITTATATKRTTIAAIRKKLSPRHLARRLMHLSQWNNATITTRREKEKKRISPAAKRSFSSPLRLIDFVDTRIGGGGAAYGSGSLGPRAQVPFGVMRLGPATSLGLEPLRLPFQQEGGYSYLFDSYIEGFAHTFTVGAGMAGWQLGLITAARISTSNINNEALIRNAGYKSKFSHATELAEPGYYQVLLDTPNVTAEFTSSGTHSGLHRYTCEPHADACTIVFDIAHGSPRADKLFDFGAAILDAQILYYSMAPDGKEVNVTMTVLDADEFTRNQPVRMWMFVSVQIDSESLSSFSIGNPQFWMNNSFVSSGIALSQSTSSGSLGILFPIVSNNGSEEHKPVVIVRTGISFIRASNALRNLQAQQQNSSGQWLSFDETKQRTQSVWEETLAKFQLKAADTAAYSDRVAVFYTTVYLAHLAPSIYTESTLEFLGLDQQVYQNAVGQRRLSDLSTWDTQRTRPMFHRFSNPDIGADLVRSMTQMSLEGRSANSSVHREEYYPAWVMANTEAFCMPSEHGINLALGLLMLNISQGDRLSSAEVQLTFDRCVGAARQQMSAMPVNADGKRYAPWSGGGGYGGTGLTLELQLVAAAVQQAASSSFMNNQTVAKEMSQYTSVAVNNLWSSEHRIFCDRFSNGTLWCPGVLAQFCPHAVCSAEVQGSYVEGNAKQYVWSAQPSMESVVNLFPSVDVAAGDLEFMNQLTALWTDLLQKLLGPGLETVLGSPGIWMGNEPASSSLAFWAWLGNKYVHRMSYWSQYWLQQYYTMDPALFVGNDDYNTMVSWAIQLQSGIFNVIPTMKYVFFAPSFDVLNYKLPLLHSAEKNGNSCTTGSGGVSLQLRAYNRADNETNYLAGVRLNGVNLTEPIVTHAQLMANVLEGEAPLVEFFCVQTPVVFGRGLDQREDDVWMPEPQLPTSVVVEIEKMAKHYVALLKKKL